MMRSTIEIGHRYLEEPVPLVEGAGFIIDPWKPDKKHPIPDAERIRHIAYTLAPHAIRYAFLDDTVLKQEAEKLGAERWRADLALQTVLEAVQLDTQAHEIYLESTFEKPAKELVTFIQKVAPHKGHKISPETGNKLFVGGDRKRTIKLMGKDGMDDPTYPSCDVLNLTWLMIRTQNYDKVTTLLPRGFEAQQERVALLADIIGIDRNVYVSEFHD